MKSETMPKKKKSYLSRLGMTLLTILLIVLFIFIMSLVSKIQGQLCRSGPWKDPAYY